MKKRVIEPFYGDVKLQKVVLRRNVTAIENLKIQLEGIKPYVQALADAYFVSPLEKHNNDIRQIFLNGASEIKNRLLADLPDNINGTPIDKERFLNQGFFKIPEYGLFNDALKACNSHNVAEYIQYFKLRGKKIVLNQAELEVYENQHSVIASTYEEIALLNSWQNFINAILEFNETLSQKCNRPLIQKFDAKRVIGNINLALWIEPDRDGNAVINAKMFEAYSKLMNKRNVSQEAEA